jgi:hypothetical protein
MKLDAGSAFIRSRTREALAMRRDHGVVLGRLGSTPADVVARVVREPQEGKTAYAIDRDQNKDAVPMTMRTNKRTKTQARPPVEARRKLLAAIYDGSP